MWHLLTICCLDGFSFLRLIRLCVLPAAGWYLVTWPDSVTMWWFNTPWNNRLAELLRAVLAALILGMTITNTFIRVRDDCFLYSSSALFKQAEQSSVKAHVLTFTSFLYTVMRFFLMLQSIRYVSVPSIQFLGLQKVLLLFPALHATIIQYSLIVRKHDKRCLGAAKLGTPGKEALFLAFVQNLHPWRPSRVDRHRVQSSNAQTTRQRTYETTYESTREGGFTESRLTTLWSVSLANGFGSHSGSVSGTSVH